MQEKEKQQDTQIVRMFSTDVPGHMAVYAGLTRIKGVSWSFSNAICNILKIDKNRKVSTLSEEEINKITTFIKNPKMPIWLLNRRKDTETGKDQHLVTIDLDLKREFDIRNLKKMRCYKGVRHSAGQPVRGQRTKAHFRQKAGGKGKRAKGPKKPEAPAKT